MSRKNNVFMLKPHSNYGLPFLQGAFMGAAWAVSLDTPLGKAAWAASAAATVMLLPLKAPYKLRHAFAGAVLAYSAVVGVPAASQFLREAVQRPLPVPDWFLIPGGR
jgi:hypothetical protein